VVGRPNCAPVYRCDHPCWWRCFLLLQSFCLPCSDSRPHQASVLPWLPVPSGTVHTDGAPVSNTSSCLHHRVQLFRITIPVRYYTHMYAGDQETRRPGYQKPQISILSHSRIKSQKIDNHANPSTRKLIYILSTPEAQFSNNTCTGPIQKPS
jgi:hypothetical protein